MKQGPFPLGRKNLEVVRSAYDIQKQKLFAYMPMRVLRAAGFVLQAVIKNLNEHICLDKTLPPGIPLGQDFFLLELIECLAFLDAGFDRGGSFLQDGNEFS